MPDITSNINNLVHEIASMAENHGRNGDDIKLLAVSKTQSAEAVRQARAAGLRAFGENYLQEALEKIHALADLDLEWHFIGAIQTNKTRPIAENFAWAHCVDREKIARRLSDQRPAHLPPLNLCIQVNIDGEDTKSGLAPNEVAPLATAIAAMPGLRLRGLMAIPQPQTDLQKQRQPFFRLHQLLDTLSALPGLADLDTLSMGMSADMEAAIAEGATIVRIGTAIFGARRPL
ncbi:MAG: YggS family pyridoxal phosphate-dependent enzyme [Porticoccaceae bacterium]